MENIPYSPIQSPKFPDSPPYIAPALSWTAQITSQNYAISRSSMSKSSRVSENPVRSESSSVGSPTR